MSDALLAAMYNLEDEPKITVQPQDPRSRRIRVGIVEYEVPTVEYLRQLEQIILRQADTLEQQRRAIERLTTAVHGTRKFVRHQSTHLSDIRAELHRRDNL